MPKILILGKGISSSYALDRVYIEPASKLNLQSDWGYKQVYYPVNEQGKLAKTVKVQFQKEWLADVKDDLDKADLILCSDSAYFKTLCKTTKVEASIGQVLQSEFTSAPIMYIPSVASYNYNPDRTKEQVNLILSKALDWFNGSYIVTGSNIIHSEYYPKTIEEIANYLDSLLSKEELAIDIETFSLKLGETGLGTIGFATDQHNGGAFAVDLGSEPTKVRELLKQFFISYKGKKIFHKTNFDVMVLIFELFMGQDLTNHIGMMEGLNTMCHNMDDTLLITYLATNTCAGNILGLKQLAAPFAGDWAVDVKDITMVDLDDLLKYNLVDCLSTMYVRDTYYPRMVQDEQEELYKGLFLDTLRTNIRMQIIGLPINLQKVDKFSRELEAERDDLLSKLNSTQVIKEAEDVLAEIRMHKRNAKLKKKVTTIDENKQPFLFTSNQDLATLLYDVMKLPIIEFTDSKQPSTSKKTIAKLMNHTENTEYLNVLQWLQDLADVEKILSAFIPAFKGAVVDKHHNTYLQGYFNLCGTVSGRLSSNSPNLQNLPSTGSRFAKPTKKVFESTDEWLFVGIDFFSLEDRISAVYTKDPNKLAVYTKHYDGHCLRAWSYYGSKMPNIAKQLEGLEIDSPEYVTVINSIQDSEYKSFRQRGKNPTFALTYQGTWNTLVRNLGFSEQEAKMVEKQYHDLYKVSDQFIQNKITQAMYDGYVTGAFGLRVRTPLLKSSIAGKKLSSEAAAEGRTAGNALGQGWGLLNDRAMNAVMHAVDNSKWAGMVQPCAKIHDACYYLIKNNAELLVWFNELVVRESLWQDHPDIYHPDVGLGGQLDIFYPNWATPLTLPTKLNQEELIELVRNHIETHKE